MKTLYEIPSKDYLLNRRHAVCIYCKDNVQEVRDYLELVCGFKKASWDTSEYTTLKWLFLDSSSEVHGSVAESGHSNKISVSIDNLLKQYRQILEYKPINLKMVEEIKLR